MNNAKTSKHAAVFSSLVVLAICSVGIFFLHLSVLANNLAIFTVAVFMAALVLLQYMNLKAEGHLIYWLMIIPMVLFAILFVLFIPDVCHYSINFLRAIE